MSKMRKLKEYEIRGDFGNPLLMESQKGLVRYSAESMDEAFEVAITLGLELNDMLYLKRTPLNRETEHGRVIDINTRQYIN